MRKIFAALAATGALASAAYAGTWDEALGPGGDAGDLLPSAHVTTGPGSLDLINGAIDPDNGDFIDVYCIRITNPAAFTASTVGLTAMDTQLFLFDSAGVGLAMSDDADAAHGGGSGIYQSAISGQFVPAAGIYYLAITPYDVDPGNSDPNYIWADSPYNVERAPDGPGAANPVLAVWGGSAFDAGTYGIALTGAEFHLTPEPASLVLLGLAAFALRRR